MTGVSCVMVSVQTPQRDSSSMTYHGSNSEEESWYRSSVSRSVAIIMALSLQFVVGGDVLTWLRKVIAGEKEIYSFHVATRLARVWWWTDGGFFGQAKTTPF